MHSLIHLTLESNEPILHLNNFTLTFQEDLEKNGADSDFHSLAEEIKTCQISELLLVFDEKSTYGTDFIMCTTQTAVAHFVGREEDAEASLVDMSTQGAQIIIMLVNKANSFHQGSI